jgi:hypothetical protein
MTGYEETSRRSNVARLEHILHPGIIIAVRCLIPSKRVLCGRKVICERITVVLVGNSTTYRERHAQWPGNGREDRLEDVQPIADGVIPLRQKGKGIHAGK